jgi:dolichol-phosphate mannosyltransferase
MNQNHSTSPLAQVGIVVPTYNEGLSIQDLLNKLLALKAERLRVHTIIVVDDSTNQDTVNAVQALGSSQIQVIKRSGKLGRGSAVIQGLKTLTTHPELNVFLEMDADLSHNPAEMPLLVNRLLSGQEGLIIGSRYLPTSQIKNWPINRRIFSKASNFLASLVLAIGVHDYTNGYRCYSRAGAELVAAKSGKYGKGFISLSETLVRLKLAGFTVGEVPTVFVNRVRGESSVSYKEIIASFVGLFKIAIYYHVTHYFERD